MRIKILAFDLETIADPEALSLLPGCEAPGNYKDPEKIRAYIAEKEAKRAQEFGLNPWTSQIAVFGWCDGEETGAIRVDETDSYPAFLENVWSFLAGFDRFATFNGNEFDVPVLLAHSVIHRVFPKVILSRRKYAVTDNHVDLRAVFSNWNQYAKGNLDLVCKRVLGVNSGKTEGVDGSQVQDLWDSGAEGREKVADYCRRDAQRVMELYSVMHSLSMV